MTEPEHRLEIVVTPLAPLFFGEPRSRSAGEAHHGRTLFPPPIQSWQGLVRTHVLRAAGDPSDLKRQGVIADIVGQPDRLPDGWQLYGPFPANADDGVVTPWFPVPRILLRRGNARPGQSRFIYARELTEPDSDCDDETKMLSSHGNLALTGRPELEATALNSHWCDAPTLLHILGGTASDPKLQLTLCKGWPPFIQDEVQPGLALESIGNGVRSAAARHGMLYFLRQMRLNDDSMFVGGLWGNLNAHIDSDQLSSSQGEWGGKSRAVWVEMNERETASRRFHPDWAKLIDGAHLKAAPASEEQRYWLTLLKPVVLEQPMDPRPRLEGLDQVRFVVESANIGRPETLGGYDYVGRKPRDNTQAIPAGSSWLFHLSGGSESLRLRALRQLNNGFVLGDPEAARFGYGQTLVGLAAPDTVLI
ncbi:MAG: type III-B CRISPR module-associated Cmr3 family protein [Thiotrichales bacterium]